jgi:plasmid stability protein
MAQFVVRQVDDDVARKLKERARRHGRSMEDEVRHILRSAAHDERRGVEKLGSRIADRFGGLGLVEQIPELHGQPARPAKFEK